MATSLSSTLGVLPTAVAADLGATYLTAIYSITGNPSAPLAARRAALSSTDANSDSNSVKHLRGRKGRSLQQDAPASPGPSPPSLPPPPPAPAFTCMACNNDTAAALKASLCAQIYMDNCT